VNIKDLGALIVVSALWGGSFLLMRVAVPSLGPVVLAESRVLIAGLVLLAFAVATRIRLEPGTHWRQYAILGALNGALPFTLIAAAELHLTASVAVVLNATTPLFGALFAAFWRIEAFTIRRLAGLTVGLLGVGVLVGWNPAQMNTASYWSVVASLGAAVAYGAAGAYTRGSVRGVSPIALSAGSQLAAAVMLLPLGALVPPTATPSTTVIVCVIALALLCTAVARVLHFQLILNVGPTVAALTTYLAPVFGILWAWMILSEKPRTGMLVGLVLILGSITLISSGSVKTTVSRAKVSC
jgi:drug/metabolite transporter (DMT)-like permease